MNARTKSIATGAVLALGLAAGGWTMLANGPAAAAEMTVWKTPSCGCCAAWVEHMRANGFAVTVKEAEDLTPVKRMAGVDPQHQSCHTGLVEGYTIEGHVPAADVERLLTEWPEAKGLAVPGMPVGSPGMEMNGMSEPYDVVLFGEDGTKVFAQH